MTGRPRSHLGTTGRLYRGTPIQLLSALGVAYSPVQTSTLIEKFSWPFCPQKAKLGLYTQFSPVMLTVALERKLGNSLDLGIPRKHLELYISDFAWPIGLALNGTRARSFFGKIG